MYPSRRSLLQTCTNTRLLSFVQTRCISSSMHRCTFLPGKRRKPKLYFVAWIKWDYFYFYRFFPAASPDLIFVRSSCVCFLHQVSTQTRLDQRIWPRRLLNTWNTSAEGLNLVTTGEVQIKRACIVRTNRLRDHRRTTRRTSVNLDLFTCFARGSSGVFQAPCLCSVDPGRIPFSFHTNVESLRLPTGDGVKLDGVLGR